MNIVLVCLDSFRADCVGARGLNAAIKTPNLDRLVGEGVLFENAFGEAQPTIQFRRALCTGMRSFPFNRRYDTTGLWPCLPGWHRIPSERPTLAEILLENGYVTGLAASSYHLFKPTQDFVRGMAAWDFIRGHEADPWRMGSLDLAELDKWWRPELEADGTPSPVLIQYLLNNRDRRGPEDYIPARVFSSAIRFIEDNRRNQPFFLWVDSFSPHEPCDPPRQYADAYDPDWNEDWRPIYCHRPDVSEKIKRRVTAEYYGEVTHVDHHLGRLLDALEACELADDTLVMVLSDHGAELWDHGHIVKTHHGGRYRHNTEIVCIMRFPGREHAGRRVEGFVLSHDFCPAILSLAGVKHPPMDGQNLMPLVAGERDRLRDYIVTGWSNAQRSTRAAVRTVEFAYSCDCDVDELDEHLFDLAADPGETRSVAAERPEVTQDLRERLRTYLGQLPYAGTVHPKLYVSPFLSAPAERWREQQ